MSSHYVISKRTYRGTKRWALAVYWPGALFDNVLAHYPTKRAAKTVARLLAGRDGTITIGKGTTA